MAERITISRPAKNDLDAIWDYLAHEGSPEIADFVIARLFEAMNRAAENPGLYPKSEFRGNPRRINVSEYAVFCESATEHSICVLRVIHGRRNIGRKSALERPHSAAAYSTVTLLARFLGWSTSVPLAMAV